MNKMNVDTNNSIKFAQPFNIAGVPQTNISQNVLDAAAINTAPKPVNIKIKVKNKEEIARGLGITLPKFSTTGPKKIRLVSSDQTIISFDLFMETGNEKKIPKKTHNKFFELFKPSGCFNNQNDDDVYPYVPSSSNETYRAKSASQVNDLQDDKICEEKFALKKNLEPMMSTNMTLKTPTFLGKCKPGGCLDPPFSEDKYIYKPKHNTLAIEKLTEKQDLDETCYKDTKHTAKDVDKVEISSEDSLSKSSIEKKCSRSLITYPPALSSSDIRDQEENSSQKSKLRTSTENEVRLSINEFSDIYYMPPKKQKSKSNEKFSTKVSENVNVRCDSFDTYSLTGHKKGQKKERIISSKNELQATDLNVVNLHINERCQKKSENNSFNDNYNTAVGAIVKIETLKVSSISDVSDTNLDVFEDTVEKKINSLASSQTNIESTENHETETKIDINVLETNVDSSYVTKSSLIFKNKMTHENLLTTATDSRISKIESNSNEKLRKPVPDKSVDNHLVASLERNKLPMENQTLRSYRLFNSDEMKIKFGPLIPPDEVNLKSSQTAVIERSTDSTKLNQMKSRVIQYEESDHLSVQEQIKNGKHKESTYSSIKEQIHDNQHKECDYSLIKEKILDREYKDSVHSSILQDREHEESTKKQKQVKEDKETDISTIKEQIQDRKFDNFEPSSLKEQTQGKKQKEFDLSSVKEQIEDKKYKKSYYSSVKEELQDKTHKIFDRLSLKEQIQDREYKESDHSSSKKQIHKDKDKEYKESDYLSLKEQTQGRETEKSNQSSIKAQIKDKKPLSSSQPSVKEQIQASEDKGTDNSSVKKELRDKEHKISNPSSSKEQLRDLEYDHSSMKEQLRDRKHKISNRSSLEELIQDREYEESDQSSLNVLIRDIELKESHYSSVKELIQDREREGSDHSSMKEEIQDRDYEESDNSSSKVQIRDKELKESHYSSVKEQIQDREREESDHLSMNEQIQDRDYEESDNSSSKVQIRDKELKESDYSSVKEQTQNRETEKSDQSSIKAQIKDKKPLSPSQPCVKEQTQAREDKGTDHSSVKKELRDREHKIYDRPSLKELIQDREHEESDHSSSKELIRDTELKASHYSSVKELIQDREREESDHSSIKEQIQDRDYEESDNSSSKVQIRDKELKESNYSSVKEQTQDREREESDHSSMKEQIQNKKHMASNYSSLKEQILDRENEESDNSSSKVQIQDKELKESHYSSIKEQTQYRENDNFDYSSIKKHIQGKENKQSDDASVIELIRNRVSDRDDHEVSDHSSLKEPIQGKEYKESNHSSLKELIKDRIHKESDYSSAKEQIQDREITDVNQKKLQQNRLLQDVDSHDIFEQGLHEIIDKNTVQDLATIMLGEATDEKSNNRMSREPSPLFQEKISSTLQTQKEDNNDLIYNANKTSLATSQIMKLTPTLNSTSTSLTLPTQKKHIIGNEPVGYENINSLVASQIIKPTSSLSLTTPLAIPDKTSSILQTQENTNDKHPEYYEKKINLATNHILKLPINLSESTTEPTDYLKIQSSEDDVQTLSSIVPIEVQSKKSNDIDHRYGVFNIIEKEESGDKRSIEIKPEFQTNKRKVTSILADYGKDSMARYYSADVSAAFNKKFENQPQMVSNEYSNIYQKSSNLNIPESFSASSKKAVVKTDKINVIELEAENVHAKNSFIKINLGFYTYVNDKNQIVIKSFDTSEHLIKDPRAKKTIIKSIIRKNDDGILIPVNSEMDLTLQIKKSLDIDTKKESTKKASRKSSDEDNLLQETVVSVYENLLPVGNIIRNLKEEAGFLTQQQVLLREMLNTMKTTSMKIINTNNKMCTCNRHSM